MAKSVVSINKVEKFENRIVIGINVYGFGNVHIEMMNKITEFCRKKNAQTTIYGYRSAWTRDNENNDVPTLANAGGAIILHSHSCDIEQSLIDFETLVK